MKTKNKLTTVVGVVTSVLAMLYVIFGCLDLFTIFGQIFSSSYKAEVSMYDVEWMLAYAYPVMVVIPLLCQIAFLVFVVMAVFHLVKNSNDMVWANPAVKNVSKNVMIAGILLISSNILQIVPYVYRCAYTGFTFGEIIKEMFTGLAYDSLAIGLFLVMIGSWGLTERQRQIEIIAMDDEDFITADDEETDTAEQVTYEPENPSEEADEEKKD